MSEASSPRPKDEHPHDEEAHVSVGVRSPRQAEESDRPASLEGRVPEKIVSRASGVDHSGNEGSISRRPLAKRNPLELFARSITLTDTKSSLVSSSSESV